MPIERKGETLHALNGRSRKDARPAIIVFLFFNNAVGITSKLTFNKEFKHCNCIFYDGAGYVLVDYDLTGINVRTLKIKKLPRFLKRVRVISSLVAYVAVYVGKRCKPLWMPLWGRTCNEVMRHSSGVDIGATITPHHFYKKLLKHNGARNYEVIETWRR